MKRKDFLKKGALGLCTIISAPVLATSYGNNDDSFSDTLEANLPDSLTGNNSDDYVYTKTMTVAD